MGDQLHIPDELLALFEKAVAGELSSDERNRLETALRQSQAIRTGFRNYVAMHVELAGAVRLARARHIVYDEVRERAAERADHSHSSSRTVAEPPAKRLEGSSARAATQQRRWLLSIGVAATLAAAVSLPIFLRQRDTPDKSSSEASVAAWFASKPPAPVATLASQQNAEWAGTQIVEGQALREGDFVTLSRGDAQISVGYGAEIAMSAPCSLSFLAADRVQLDHGEVAVHVAEWAKGFTVVTDSMEVVDLGTTFTVSASDDGRDETRVLKGLVRVHARVARGEEQRGLLVSEGEALMVDHQGGRKNHRPPDQHVRASLRLASITPYRPVELHNTGHGLEVGDEDRHWRVVAGPAGFAGEEYASVCVPDERYLPNETTSSQWVSTTNWRGTPPNSVYTFQTSFNLDGYDLSTIQLFGRFLADNGVAEIRVNGKPVKVESWIDAVTGQRFDRPQFRFVNVTDGLIEGGNIVEIDVRNGTMSGETIPNPMALRVEWYAFGRRAAVVSSDGEGGPERDAVLPGGV